MAVPKVKERLTEVEKDVARNAHGIESLRDTVSALQATVADLSDRMERRFEAVDRRLEALFRMQLATTLVIIAAIAGVALMN